MKLDLIVDGEIHEMLVLRPGESFKCEFEGRDLELRVPEE